MLNWSWKRRWVPGGTRGRKPLGRVSAFTALVALALIGAGCGVNLGIDGVNAKWDDVERVDGRKMLVVTPETHDVDDAENKLPLVVNLHGLGNSAELMATMAEWPQAVLDHNLLMVFGEGVDASWNAGGCCGTAQSSGVDDIAYLDAVVAQMVAEYGADPDQVFLTGYSNGGMMTYRYVCERPELLAGAASVAGTNYSDCEPGGATSFLQISGDADTIVPPLGGPSVVPDVGEVPSVPVSVGDLSEGAGCTSSQAEALEGFERLTLGDCRDGAVIRYDLVHGLDHIYPTDATFPAYVATDQILDFWGLSERESAEARRN